MIDLLNKNHIKTSFNCGNEQLNNYLKHQASQDIKRKLSVCFVLSDKITKEIKGYYTLANNSIPLSSFPQEIQKKFPKSYVTIPTTLIGRLAIAEKFQKQGIGKLLLIDALKRSYTISKEIGSYAVVVDPIDKNAENFYSKFDFIKLPDCGKMIISIKTLQLLFES